MRVIIGLILFLFLSNIGFAAENIDKKIEASKDLRKIPENKKIKTSEDLRKILENIRKNKPNITKNYQRTPEDQFKKILRDLKPFLIFIFIIIMVAATRSGRDEDSKKEGEQLDDSSDSTLKKAIKRFKKKKKEEADKDEDDWKADKVNEDDSDWLSGQEPLKIKVEKEKIEKILSYVVKGKGGIFIDNKLLKKDANKVKFSIYVFDITDPKNKVPLTSSSKGWYDEEYILCNNREMEITHGAGYWVWSPMFYFPELVVVPPYQGKRKLEFKLYATSLNTKFSKGSPVVKNKKTKTDAAYLIISTKMEIEFDEPGYEEVKEFVDDVNEHTVQLGLALASSDGHMDQREINIVKDWIDRQYHWSMFDYLNFDDWKERDKEKQNKEKIKFSFVLKNTYNQLRDNRLSMSEIVKGLNTKATRIQKYDAVQLLLNIAGSDEKLSIKEDQLLNKTARALNLDIEQFQKMKNSAIANIENIEHSEQINESIFNITENMSKAEKCKLLRKEYTRWNAQTNNTNEKLRAKAKKMVELAAKLRKKYKC